MSGPSMGVMRAFEPSVRKTISDSKLAVLRRHRVTTTNRRRVCDISVVNLEVPEAYALHLSERTTMAPGLQELVSGDTTRMGGNLKQPSTVTTTDYAGVKGEPPKTKTSRPEIQVFRTAEPAYVCDVRAAPEVPIAVD